MKTRLQHLTIALILVSGVAHGQARFEVQGGLERSFGRIPLADIHDTLTILNPGTAALHIIAINPTCGCTAAVIDSKVIPPGGKAHVYVKIEPPDVMGKTHKTIEFLTNDLSNPKSIVGFGFEVLRDIGASPRNFPFAGCRIHQPCVESVMLYNVSSVPVSFIRMPMTMPGLHSLMPDSISIAAHDSLKYRLELTGDTTGLMTGKYRLRTTSALNPMLEFSVFANIADKNGMPEMPKGR